MIKINNQELRLLAEKYNSDGKQAMYVYLREEYGIHNPTCIFKRMKKQAELGYHPETDRLLEISRYISINSISKTLIIDKTSLVRDGYRVTTH